MFKTYSVESGPNNSHLFNVKHFDRLKDAKDYIQSLPLAPTGEDRPYRLNRNTFASRKAFCYNTCDVLEERMM